MRDRYQLINFSCLHAVKVRVDTLTSKKCLTNISAPLTASLAGAARNLTSVGEDETELSFESNQITTNVPPSPEPGRPERNLESRVGLQPNNYMTNHYKAVPGSGQRLIPWTGRLSTSSRCYRQNVPNRAGWQKNKKKISTRKKSGRLIFEWLKRNYSAKWNW